MWIFRRIFEKNSPEKFWATVSGVQPGWALAALASCGLMCGFAIVRWHAILRVQGLNLGWGRTSGIFFIGAFFNTFMLGATGGDISKAYYVARETKHKQAEAVATVIVDRVIGLLALLVFCTVFLTINASYLLREADAGLRGAAFAVILLMVGAVASVAMSLSTKLREWLLKWLPPRFQEVLRRAAEAYQGYIHHPGVVAQTFGLSLGVHTCTTLISVLLAFGMGLVDVSVGKFFLILPLINFLAAMPVSLMGLGVREALYEKLLGPLGLELHEAVVLSLLFFVTTLLWNLVGGVIFLLWREREHHHT